MKKIECIIRSERLKDITDALKKIGIGGMTVSEVRGFGAQSERTDNFLFVHKTKIEIYAADSQIKDIVSMVLTYCSTGKIGDGKIVVLPIDDCIRISTGERKNKAILKRGGKKE
ncbi:MAG: P-II family nitrogen regulator [Candidatus Omnitrophica bacterium]|nr:P-II family nitrogen regulator [Candidatus Omnitrophota bacterium]MBI5145097.1 P-II family nitrogen regulator [Candidatus Omnitrophota bacterium]